MIFRNSLQLTPEVPNPLYIKVIQIARQGIQRIIDSWQNRPEVNSRSTVLNSLWLPALSILALK